MCVCPLSIVSESSLLHSVATCSWHFPFFEYVVIAVQYLRTSHGIHVHVTVAIGARAQFEDIHIKTAKHTTKQTDSYN